MTRCVIVIPILAAFLATTAPSLAADAARGEQLARQWCANCHIIGETAPGPVQQGPPSFRTVAKEGPRGDQLRAFLSHPHGAMPDLTLSRAEIDDLIAYIASLR